LCYRYRVENEVAIKSVLYGCSSLRAAVKRIYALAATLWWCTPLILVLTKGKRNNTFHEGHVVQRRPRKVLSGDTRLLDISSLFK